MLDEGYGGHDPQSATGATAGRTAAQRALHRRYRNAHRQDGNAMLIRVERDPYVQASTLRPWCSVQLGVHGDKCGCCLLPLSLCSPPSRGHRLRLVGIDWRNPRLHELDGPGIPRRRYPLRLQGLRRSKLCGSKQCSIDRSAHETLGGRLDSVRHRDRSCDFSQGFSHSGCTGTTAQLAVLVTGIDVALSLTWGVFSGVLGTLHRFDIISAIEISPGRCFAPAVSFGYWIRTWHSRHGGMGIVGEHLRGYCYRFRMFPNVSLAEFPPA